MTQPLSSMRMSYELARLGDEDVDRDPMAQFSRWFAEVLDSHAGEANALILSTVGPDCIPSSRTVLLKQFDQGGFVFFTNYESQKGREIATHPHVAALFYWSSLQRQVRIGGIASRISDEESDTYFHSRPPGSQIGAIVSPQSQVIPSREWLEERFVSAEEALERRESMERPAHWGGFRIAPHSIEFWQGRPNRLHDRIRYMRLDDETWDVHRLAP